MTKIVTSNNAEFIIDRVYFEYRNPTQGKYCTIEFERSVTMDQVIEELESNGFDKFKIVDGDFTREYSGFIYISALREDYGKEMDCKLRLILSTVEADITGA